MISSVHLHAERLGVDITRRADALTGFLVFTISKLVAHLIQRETEGASCRSLNRSARMFQPAVSTFEEREGWGS